jgi:hypothetical protein
MSQARCKFCADAAPPIPVDKDFASSEREMSSETETRSAQTWMTAMSNVIDGWKRRLIIVTGVGRLVGTGGDQDGKCSRG